MQDGKQTLLAVGDVILGPNPDYYFAPSKTVLKKADLLLGSLRSLTTDKGRYCRC